MIKINSSFAKFSFILLFLLSIFLFSCHERKNSALENQKVNSKNLQKRYEQLLKNCTRYGYLKIEHRVPVQVRVTYRSPLLKEFFLQGRKNEQNSKPYLNALSEEETKKRAQMEEFFFSLHGSEKDWYKLLPQNLSPWSIYLNIREETKLKPALMEEIFSSKNDLFLYYRPLSSWANNYLVYFTNSNPNIPLINDTVEEFQIIMTGAPGRIVLTWNKDDLTQGIN